MGGTDQMPLSLHLGQPPQEELPEAHGLFDLTEHRFHHLFPESVGAAPASTLQFVAHSGDQGRVFAIVGVDSRLGSVFLATGGDICLDLPGFQALQIGSAYRTLSPGLEPFL